MKQRVMTNGAFFDRAKDAVEGDVESTCCKRDGFSDEIDHVDVEVVQRDDVLNDLVQLDPEDIVETPEGMRLISATFDNSGTVRYRYASTHWREPRWVMLYILLAAAVFVWLPGAWPLVGIICFVVFAVLKCVDIFRPRPLW